MTQKKSLVPITEDLTSGDYTAHLTSSYTDADGRIVPYYKEDVPIEVFPQMFDTTTNNKQYWHSAHTQVWNNTDGIITVEGIGWVHYNTNLAEYFGTDVILRVVARRISTQNVYLHMGGVDESPIIDQDWCLLEFHFSDRTWWKNGLLTTRTDVQSQLAEGQFSVSKGKNTRKYQIRYIELSAYTNTDFLPRKILFDATMDVSRVVNGTYKVQLVKDDGEIIPSTDSNLTTAELLFKSSDEVYGGSYTIDNYNIINRESAFTVYEGYIYFMEYEDNELVWKCISATDNKSYLSIDTTSTGATPVISYSPYLYNLPSEVISGGSLTPTSVTVDTPTQEVEISFVQEGTDYNHINLAATITCEGEPVPYGLVRFKRNTGESSTSTPNTLMGTIEVEEGTASIPFTQNVNSGYRVRAQYMGYNTYQSIYTDIAPLTINPLNTTTTLDSFTDGSITDTYTASGTVTDNYDDPVVNATVQLDISMTNHEETLQQTTTTDGDGNYEISLELPYSNETYTIMATTQSSTNYASSQSTSRTLTLTDDITLTLEEITGDLYARDTVTFTGTALYNGSVPVPSTDVTLTIENTYLGEVTETVTTDSSGVYSYEYTLPYTNYYTVSAVLDDGTVTASQSITLTVFRCRTSISLDAINDCYVGDTVTLHGVVMDTIHSLPIANKAVYLQRYNSHGDPYWYTMGYTNTDGEYTYSFTATTAGLNTATVSIGNDNTYRLSETANEFTVYERTGVQSVLSVNSIADCQIGDTVTISGTLLDSDNNPITNATVNMTIGTDSLTATTDSNGAYTTSYTTTTSGSKTVNLSYSGDSTYIGSSTSTTFTVTQATAFETHFSTQSLWTNYANMTTYTSGDVTYWVSASSSSTKHYYTEYNMQEILSHGDISMMHYTHGGDGRSNLCFYDPTNDKYLGYNSSINNGTVKMVNTKDGTSSSATEIGYGAARQVTISLSGTTLTYTYPNSSGTQKTATIDVGSCDLSNYYLCFYTYSKSMDVLFDTEITD